MLNLGNWISQVTPVAELLTIGILMSMFVPAEGSPHSPLRCRIRLRIAVRI